MLTDEPGLLAQLESCGFEFTATAREMTRRFPQELDWGVPSSVVLPVRLTEPFAGFGPIWKMPVSRELDFDLPPTMYFHEFHPTGDVQANFDQAVEQLTPVLGDGQVGRASNTFERSWRIGFFTIRVIAWPKDRNAGFRNVYEGRNPYLWIDAKIYVQPEFPFVHPTEDAGQPLRELLTPAPGCTLVCDSPVYARRNRVLAGRDALVAGTDGTAFVIRANDRSVRVPLEDIQRVVLTRMTPGRFSGSSSLSLNTILLGRHGVRVPVANGTETSSLDRIAPVIASALSKPLTLQEYSDDG